MKNNLIKTSFVNALGVAVYCSVVAYVMQNGEHLFGKMQNFWGPLSFLMLFVVSAAIVGSLVFGKPAMMYLGGEKKEAVRLLGYTLVWLFLATLILLIIQYFIKG